MDTRINLIPEDYFSWLCGRVAYEGIDLDNYTDLLLYLNSVEFTWSIKNDKNRASYGHALREEFSGGSDYILGALDADLPYPCTVLEMFVALSIICENDIMHEIGGPDNTGKWFWTAMDNMGLLYFDNENFIESEVGYIIYTFLDRQYDPDGNKGPFPLKHTSEDMRDIEIWGQLNRYLYENY